MALKEGHKPTADYVKKLRQVLPAAFPEDTFYFQAADIVTQILNFGLPAQIDVRTVGYDKNNLSVARELRQRLAAIPGIVDAHLQQEVDAPAFYAQIDRTRAAQLGLNASTVATNINVSLSSSEQVSPAGAQSQLAQCACKHAGFHLAGGERPGCPWHAQ